MRDLNAVQIPGEAEAEERAWKVVGRAFAEHEPSPVAAGPTRRARLSRPAIAMAVITAAVIGVAVSPAGSQIVHSVRRAVGLQHAAPALTRLPAAGSLLVTSAAGPWVVHPDGSKRLLGRYAEASWSPHGLFVAVTRKHELLAVDPSGNVHWSLGRAGEISLPRWAPDGYRIAYLEGASLRIVVGDGTADRLLRAHVTRVAPAWRPSSSHEHVLAFVAAGRLDLVDVDTGRVLANHRLPSRITEVIWSPDGQRLAAVGVRRVSVFNRDGTPLASVRLTRPAGAASFEPGSHRLTLVLGGRRSDAVTFNLDRPTAPPLEVFSGSGHFSELAWAPNGRWLLLAWPTADQWLFVPAGDGTAHAVAGVAAQFSPGLHHVTTPVIDGWCCQPDAPS